MLLLNDQITQCLFFYEGPQVVTSRCLQKSLLGCSGAVHFFCSCWNQTNKACQTHISKACKPFYKGHMSSNLCNAAYQLTALESLSPVDIVTAHLCANQIPNYVNCGKCIKQGKLWRKPSAATVTHRHYNSVHARDSACTKMLTAKKLSRLAVAGHTLGPGQFCGSSAARSTTL